MYMTYTSNILKRQVTWYYYTHVICHLMYNTFQFIHTILIGVDFHQSHAGLPLK